MSAGHCFHRDDASNISGERRIYFTFNTNNGSAINTSLIFGAADYLTTINNANTGEFIVTMSPKDFYNKVVYASAVIEDAGVGLSAGAGVFTNEGATNSAPIVFKVFTYNSSNAVANVANTRVFVEVVFRDRSPIVRGDP